MKKNSSVGKIKLGINKPHLQLDKFKSVLYHQGGFNTKVTTEKMKLHLQIHRKVSSSVDDGKKNPRSLEKIDPGRTKVNRKSSSQKENVIKRLSKKDYCEPQNGKSLKIESTNPKKHGNSLNPSELDRLINRSKASSSIQASENSYSNKFTTNFLESNQSVIEEFEKSKKEFKRQPGSNKPYPGHISIQSREDRLEITQMYSDVLQFKRNPRLFCEEKIVDYFVMFGQPERAEQFFWVLCQKKSSNSYISPEELNFLLENVNMVKSINQGLSQKTQKLDKKLRQLEQRNRQIEKQHQRFDEQITNKKYQLSAVQQKIVQMKNYINQQPNQFLRIMVDQYKKSQQQLFNLADFLNVTSAEKIDIWTGQTLKMAKKHHETFLKDLCNRNFDENNKCHIDKEEMEYLRGKIKQSHCEMTLNFEKVLSVRIQRIKQFIELMEKIAVNTVAKRSYLDQINQKVMGIYVLIEPLQNSIEEKMTFIRPHNAQEDELKTDLLELKKLIKAAHDLYIQAQIFY